MVKSEVLVIGGGPGGYLAAERAAQKHFLTQESFTNTQKKVKYSA